MAEQPRSDQDIYFAREVASRFHIDLLGGREITRPYGLGAGSDDGRLLKDLEAQVSRYTGSPDRFLSPPLRHYLEAELAKARRLLDAGQSGVMVFERAGNGFGLNVIVDIFNDRARRAIAAFARRRFIGDDDGSETGGDAPETPPLSRAWARIMEDSGAPVRMADAQTAADEFLTLFTDALRTTANSGGGGGGAGVPGGAGGGGPTYRANCNLSGWFLECWPQYNYSPARFGAVRTWPVDDTLPTPGNYEFQGLKGGSIRKDPSPHYFGPSRTSTIVKL